MPARKDDTGDCDPMTRLARLTALTQEMIDRVSALEAMIRELPGSDCAEAAEALDRLDCDGRQWRTAMESQKLDLNAYEKILALGISIGERRERRRAEAAARVLRGVRALRAVPDAS